MAICYWLGTVAIAVVFLLPTVDTHRFANERQEGMVLIAPWGGDTPPGGGVGDISAEEIITINFKNSMHFRQR